jgi:hypothetical protein
MDFADVFGALGHVCVAMSILGSGKGSRRIDARAAQNLQNGADNVGEVLIWTVYRSPGRYVTRPCMTSGGITPMPVHLEAPTLEQPRAQLPAGLTRTDRLPDDDPRVVETWQ